MCASCVAQGAPYVLGSVVALRVMASSARRQRLRSEAGRSEQVPARPADPTG